MLLQSSRVLRAIVACTAAGMLLSACAAPGSRAPAPRPEAVPGVAPEARQSFGERAAAVAVRQVGVPYRYGGKGEAGFDCSGLVHFAYARAGKSIPRTTADLWRQTRPVPERDLAVGDILFFDIEGKVSHVGLYLGRGRFVHAPSTGREVTVADLDSGYYRRVFLRGGRPR